MCAFSLVTDGSVIITISVIAKLSWPVSDEMIRLIKFDKYHETKRKRP